MDPARVRSEAGKLRSGTPGPTIVRPTRRVILAPVADMVLLARGAGRLGQAIPGLPRQRHGGQQPARPHGAAVSSTATYGRVASLQFVAPFSGRTPGSTRPDGQQFLRPVQHLAAAVLCAHVRPGGATDTPLAGNWLEGSHLFRIDWNTAASTLHRRRQWRPCHAPHQRMQLFASDTTPAGSVTVQRLRVTPYAAARHLPVAGLRCGPVGELVRLDVGASTSAARAWPSAYVRATRDARRHLTPSYRCRVPASVGVRRYLQYGEPGVDRWIQTRSCKNVSITTQSAPTSGQRCPIRPPTGYSCNLRRLSRAGKRW